MSTPIKITHPHIIQYLKNKQDGDNYTHGSNKYIECICPNCKYEKLVMISNLCKKGFYCPICSDGISYAEKFIIYLLQQLNIKYIYQLTKKDFKWCDKYRYDFYLIDYNTIIETHGSQHYDTPFLHKNAKTIQETQQNDIDKKILALNNNIKEDCYIVIDARKRNKQWMINSIKQSMLSQLFNLDDINWNEIDAKSNHSILADVCRFYEINKPIETKDIAKIFHINVSTIVRYLNVGNKNKLCTYDGTQERIKAGQKGNEIVKKLLSKPVNVYKNEQFIKSYSSAKELYKQSLTDYGIQFCYSSICEVCRGVTKQHHGYVFKYKQEDIKC